MQRGSSYSPFLFNGDVLMNQKKRRNLHLILFCAPALIVYLVFKLIPAIFGIGYAMTDWNGLGKNFHFIGLDNFITLFKDEYFWKSIGFTLKYVLVIVVVANVVALSLAVAIESRKHARGIYRTIYYMPNMISMVIGGYMWMFIFTQVLYYIADHWGWRFFDHSWIGDPHYSFIAIIIVATWSLVGYLMIIYLAALQGVPKQLLEAAHIAGANAWQCFFRVTLPLILPAVTICVFWTINSGFQVFDVIYALTGGGPGRATQSVAMNIYEEAFKGNLFYGYATAKSTLLFLMVMTVTIIQIKVMRSREVEL